MWGFSSHNCCDFLVTICLILGLRSVYGVLMFLSGVMLIASLANESALSLPWILIWLEIQQNITFFAMDQWVVTQAVISRHVIVVITFLHVGTCIDCSRSWCYILDWDRCAFFCPPVCILFLHLQCGCVCSGATMGGTFQSSSLEAMDNCGNFVWEFVYKHLFKTHFRWKAM